MPRVENVVLLTVDTLRADQPWAGNHNLSTPHLSRLAEQSVLYTRAYALAHFTTASLNGLLSSRYPSELSRSNCHLGSYELPESLAATLTSAGIATFAAHGHAIFAGSAAPRQGFAEWRLIRGAAGRMQTDGAVTGADIANLVSTYLGEKRPPGRLFAWAHFVDPHDSYVSHAKFPARSNAPRDIYDSEVAYTDSVIGDVLASIERAGMAKTTAIIVTADHGEAFGEHGTVHHGSGLYEEEIHVPLMIYAPGVAPRSIDVPRSAIDIAPTIAELLGIKPAESWAGVSLLADLNGAPAPRVVLLDVPPVGIVHAKQAVIRDSLKVIFDGDAPASVYDLRSDPAERSPLVGDAASAAAKQAKTDLARIHSVPGTPCPPSNRAGNKDRDAI